MMFLKKLFNRYKVNRQEIDINQTKLVSLLNDKLPEHKLFALDGKYRVPHTDDLNDFIKNTKIDENNYLSNFYDCENFAFHFHSILALNYHINSCGIVISYESAHAFNVLVSHQGGKDNLQVNIFEPQSDNMWLPNKDKNNYKIEDQIILI